MPVLFPQEIQPNGMLYLDGSAGHIEEIIVTAGVKGTKVYSVGVRSDDPTNEVHAVLSITDGTVSSELCSIPIPAGAAVNLLSPTNLPTVDSDGAYLLGPGILLTVKLVGSLTGGSKLYISSSASNY